MIMKRLHYVHAAAWICEVGITGQRLRLVHRTWRHWILPCSCGANYQKFIELTKNNKVIAVNSCENCCPETILKTKDATVEYNLNVSKLLKKYDLHAECTVRINENDEKCVNIVKNEILKIKNELEDS